MLELRPVGALVGVTLPPLRSKLSNHQRKDKGTMGLDIYCRWGDVNEDGEVINGMTEAEKQAQYTGYNDAPEAGYMRYNWLGVGFVTAAAEVLDIQSPIAALWPDWQGSNSEELIVDADQMARLVEARSAINAWLLDMPATPQAMIPDESNRVYFLGKLRKTIAMIDFIEAHKDCKGLRLEFN